MIIIVLFITYLETWENAMLVSIHFIQKLLQFEFKSPIVILLSIGNLFAIHTQTKVEELPLSMVSVKRNWSFHLSLLP